MLVGENEDDALFMCVMCPTLRGTLQSHRMANLPADWLSAKPPLYKLWSQHVWPLVNHHTPYKRWRFREKKWAVTFI